MITNKERIIEQLKYIKKETDIENKRFSEENFKKLNQNYLNFYTDTNKKLLEHFVIFCYENKTFSISAYLENNNKQLKNIKNKKIFDYKHIEEQIKKLLFFSGFFDFEVISVNEEGYLPYSSLNICYKGIGLGDGEDIYSSSVVELNSDGIIAGDYINEYTCKDETLRKYLNNQALKIKTLIENELKKDTYLIRQIIKNIKSTNKNIKYKNFFNDFSVFYKENKVLSYSFYFNEQYKLNKVIKKDYISEVFDLTNIMLSENIDKDIKEIFKIKHDIEKQLTCFS